MPEQDPVHFREGKWWFWDETWANEIGPHTTEAEARVALDRYVRYLATGKEENAL